MADKKRGFVKPPPGMLANVGPRRYVSVDQQIRKKKEAATVNKYKELKAQEEAKERRKQKKKERRKRKRDMSGTSGESDHEEPTQKLDAAEATGTGLLDDAPVFRGKEAIGTDDVYDQMLANIKKKKRERDSKSKRVKLNDGEAFIMGDDDNKEKEDEEDILARIQKRAMMTSGGDDDEIEDAANVVGAGANSSDASGRRQRAQRPHAQENQNQKKMNPFAKERKEFEDKQAEKERIRQEREEREAQRKAKKVQRTQQKKDILYKRTKTGQPVMKGLMNQLLGKIEASIARDGPSASSFARKPLQSQADE